MIFTQDDILQITDPINFPLGIIGAGFEDVFTYYIYHVLILKRYEHSTLISIKVEDKFKFMKCNNLFSSHVV